MPHRSPPRNFASFAHSASKLLPLAAPLLLLTACRAQSTTPLTPQPLTNQTLTVCGSTLNVTFSNNGPLDLPETDVLHWVQTAGDSVATYYGHFPVPQTTVRIRITPGDDGVLNGTTFGGNHVMQRMGLGEHTTVRQLNDDWTMTHEFIHTAFPDLDEQHHWIEEGLSVYVEPLARVQHGVLPAETVWRDMIHDMPKGEPDSGARGLDHDRGWASTYWGGALFFLNADIAIREQTHNQKSLQDALRAILDAGQNITVDGTPESAFAIGDKATGTHILTDLYTKAKDSPVTFDLPTLWKKLGIQSTRTGLTFDDKAPDAQIRRTFFTPKPNCLTK